MSRHNTREEWLQDAVIHFQDHFKAAGWKIPKNVRVSCGLPSRGAFGAKKRTIGEAWSTVASKDQHHEVFISPTIDEAPQVLATLVHELVHVTVGLETGHKGDFVKCARDVGLVGPWTSTEASDALLDRLNALARLLGKYPHAALTKMTNGKKKQKARLELVRCVGCNYKARIAMSWIIVGIPKCPNPDCPEHDQPMAYEDMSEIQEPTETETREPIELGTL